MKYWTGVGSRDITPEQFKIMEEIGSCLASLGWILRSGGAAGSDTAFEKGVDDIGSRLKHIYIPWGKPGYQQFLATDYAAEIAPKYVPHWSVLRSPHRKLHIRNINQVIGHEETPNPSSVLVACTRDGGYKGGTATALRCADDFGVPIVNIGDMRYRHMSAGTVVETIMRLVND